MQRGQDRKRRGQPARRELGGLSWGVWAGGKGVGFSLCLAGDPDPAGGRELRSGGAALLRALD